MRPQNIIRGSLRTTSAPSDGTRSLNNNSSIQQNVRATQTSKIGRIVTRRAQRVAAEYETELITQRRRVSDLHYHQHPFQHSHRHRGYARTSRTPPLCFERKGWYQ